uniref:pre-mRNA-processing factor 39-like isoform X1 n=1 Tax=Pristiophorus japonicus TaxID=55135 RepID=UPI00398E3FB0
MEAAKNRWSEPNPNPLASDPSGGGEQKLLDPESLEGGDQCVAQNLAADSCGPYGDQNDIEGAAADLCDVDTGGESAADSPGPSEADTAEDSVADSTGPSDGDTGEDSAADTPGPNDGETGEESVADSTGPNDGDTGEDSAADSTGPSDGDSAEDSAADSTGPSDGNTGEDSAADTPGPCDMDTVEESAADSTGPNDGDTGEESGADTPGPCDMDTGEESAADSTGPNDGDTGDDGDSGVDGAGPCDGDTIEDLAADSPTPGPCDGDTFEALAAANAGPCDGDTIEDSAADSPTPDPCDGDTVEALAADSPTPDPCDGVAVEDLAADSPTLGPYDRDIVEALAADSPTPDPCDGVTIEDLAADSPTLGPCDGDIVEALAAASPGPCDGDIVEALAADSPTPGPCDGDTVEALAVDIPGPCDGDTVEALAVDSLTPGPCDGDTVEALAADAPGPCDGDTVATLAADFPGPCDGDIVEALAADSPTPGPCDGDTVETLAADSPTLGPCDEDTVEALAADSPTPAPCDGDTVQESAADVPGPCDDTVEELAADSPTPGPCDGDTVEAWAADSPTLGPCDGDTVEALAADSPTPGPCDGDTIEQSAAGALSPCNGNVVDYLADAGPSPCDGNNVEKSAADASSPAGALHAAEEPAPSPEPPCDQVTVTEMETDSPDMDQDAMEVSATECPSPGDSQGTVQELATDASSLPLPGGVTVQEAVTQFPEGSNGPELAVDKALANSNGAEYAAAAEGSATASLDEYGQDSSEYGALEPEDSIPPYPADFEKYWKIVADNPYDFTGWTYVLQYVEQENHIWAVRKAFDAFFARYPYCYGYWKKYADIEKRLGFTKETEEVYQRGLQSIPLSVDLWVHYISYLQEILEPTSPETPVKLRSVYEMALAAAGTDFRSDRLWDLYVSWEKEQGQLKAVTAIYDRVLSIPTQLYSHHFEKFKEHVQNYSPKDILSTDEFLRLRSEVVTSLAVTEADCDEGPPGDDPPPGVGTTDQEKADTELEKIRAHLGATRHEMYLLNEEEVSKRWNFEEAIKRPYFHVKPLERVQLKNWKDYLDFEIAGGTNERVLVLFERCVIACALYEDFWIKYAKYLESHSVEGVRNVFQRACMVHLPKKPTLHLLWAAFEEQQGDLDESRRILNCFQLVVPGLAMVFMRRVSLERRCGDLDQAEALLREAIEQHRDTPLASFFAVKLARQLLKVQKSLSKARKVLLEAIERDKENTKLYLNLLELEFSSDVRINESNILSCFNQVLSSSLPIETKIIFSQRRVEFLEDFGCSVRSLLHAYDEHQKLLKQNSSKKRAAENGTEEPEEKKARVEEASTVSVASTTVTTTNSTALMSGDVTSSQAAYNYSAWYQPYGSYSYQNPWNYSQYYPHS